MSFSLDARVELTFRPTSEGGRATPVLLQGFMYRPHLQVLDGTYLGVLCGLGPAQPVRPGETAECELAFVYSPGVSYDELAEGVEFKVMEGAACVGTGRVLERYAYASIGLGGKRG